MYTATERFHDAAALLSAIESRTVREGRRAFAWQMAQRARRTRRERIIEAIHHNLCGSRVGGLRNGH
nr:MAG TPA: hypothetical protein [Caudoviricetes sp.]